jgi:hypothetical protein
MLPTKRIAAALEHAYQPLADGWVVYENSGKTAEEKLTTVLVVPGEAPAPGVEVHVFEDGCPHFL